MLARRTFFVAGSLALPRSAAQKLALYANVGADLTHYEVGVVSAELTKRETITLPAVAQYAWPHALRQSRLVFAHEPYAEMAR